MARFTGFDVAALRDIAAEVKLPADNVLKQVLDGLHGLAPSLLAAAKLGFAPVTQAANDITRMIAEVPSAGKLDAGRLLQVIFLGIDRLLKGEGFVAVGEEPHDFGVAKAPDHKVFYVRRAELTLFDAIDDGQSVILATSQDVRRFGRAVIARYLSGNGCASRRVFHWTTSSGLFEAVQQDGTITYLPAGDPDLYSVEITVRLLSEACASNDMSPTQTKEMLTLSGFTPLQLPSDERLMVCYIGQPVVHGRDAAQEIVIGDLDDDESPFEPEQDKLNDMVGRFRKALREFLSVRDRFPRSNDKGETEDFTSMHALMAFIMARQPEGALFVLYDGEVFLDKELIGGGAALTGAFLRDACSRLRRSGNGTQIVVLSAPVTLPAGLSGEVTHLPLPLPSRYELMVEIRARAAQFAGLNGTHPIQITDELRNIVDAAAGMTMSDAISTIRHAKRTGVDKADELVAELYEAKRTAINRSAALELIDREPPSELKLGGMDKFWAWLSVRGRVFRYPEQAAQVGIDRRPKGVLILGVPGTGKSLAAKMIAREWRVPLVRLDLGAVQNRFVGGSEERMREALTTVQAMSPCVLWIDEIDKGIAQGEGTSTHTAEMNTRATLLTWLQENDSAVFVVATANRFANLPPELTRAGRFDARFFFGCSDKAGREQILRIHLNLRCPTNIDDTEVTAIADRMHGFTGAEIEQTVLDGLYRAFAIDRKVCVDDFLQAAADMKPLIRASGRALDEVWALIEQGRVELASEHFLTRVDVTRLINPEAFSPMYCRLDQIQGWEKHAERAQRMLIRDQFGARAAVALETGDPDWIYVQTNLKLDPGDPAPFKFLDRLQEIASNGVFDRLVVEGGLEMVWCENEALRERFKKHNGLAAFDELLGVLV